MGPTPSCFSLCAGVLCGKCPNGTGVSALLSRCVTCSNKNLLLVVTLGRKALLDENTVSHIFHPNIMFSYNRKVYEKCFIYSNIILSVKIICTVWFARKLFYCKFFLTTWVLIINSEVV